MTKDIGAGARSARATTAGALAAQARRSSCVAALLLAACGGGGATSQPVKAPEDGPLSGELTDAEGKPAPKWVTQPAKYRKDDDGNKVVCAEGSIGGTASMSMAQTASAGRARTALARNLETKVVAMLKDYQSTTTGGAQFKSAANDEQHVQDASKQITNTTLSGTEVTDTWISKTSTMHSLVCLNVEKFKGAVAGMKQLDEQIRQAVVQRAEKAWDELDAVDGQAAPPPPPADPQPQPMSARGATQKMGAVATDPTPERSGTTDLYEKASRGVVVVTAKSGPIRAIGAGSLIGPHTVLTNYHVIAPEGRQASKVRVFTKPAGMTTGNLERDLTNPIEATVARVNAGWDLAVLELASSADGYPTIPIADGPATLGERTIAIGHPEDGGAWSVTTGVVSNRLADFENTPGKNVYQIQTPINPGNSGGPLLNGAGEMLGVTTSAVRVGKSGHTTEGIQFAVASDVVKTFLAGPANVVPTAARARKN